MRVRLLFFFLGCLLMSALSAFASIAEVNVHPVEMAKLDHSWLLQFGDDLDWARPDYDDSKWSKIRTDHNASNTGVKGHAGYLWYRLHLVVPDWPEPLGLYIPAWIGTFEIYANGQPIGKLGQITPPQNAVVAKGLLFSIPATIATPGQPLVLAIRAWRWSLFAGVLDADLLDPPLLGTEQALARWQALEAHDRFWNESGSVMSFLANLLTALAGLSLFALRRTEREYLWFGAAQVLWAAQSMIHVLLITIPMPYTAIEGALVCITSGAKFLNLLFFITLLRQRKGGVYWTAAASIVLMLLLLAIAEMEWIQISRAFLMSTILEFIYGISVPVLLWRGARSGHVEAKLLIVPFTLSFLCNAATPLFTVSALMRVHWIQQVAGYFSWLCMWPFPMRTTVLAGNLALFSVVAVLVLRFARSRRDEERLAKELEAASAVQHVLIPDEIPAVPGFQIQCVYKPAGEVGGDFFQILPVSAGEALIVIGDVSGKGMPAAMTVSMMVGMVRMLTRSTQRPAEILTAINRSMMGRFTGGFITCLVLHIAQSGTITAANAGHVAPYVNGKELQVANGLPLGVEASALYAESSFQLAPEDQITLLTDGVVEARRANGELFGFERVASISSQPAAEIAAAAQQFGQGDDITVLSLTRQPAGKSPVTLVDSSLWSTATV